MLKRWGVILLVLIAVVTSIVLLITKPFAKPVATLETETTSSLAAQTALPATLTPAGQTTTTPNLTPLGTGTNVPTPTANPPLYMQSCPFSVGCPAITDVQHFIQGQVLPGNTYTVEVPYNAPLRIGAYWMSFKPGAESLDQNALRFFFEIDGRDYAKSEDVAIILLADPKTPSKSRPAAGIGYVLQGWEAGKPHTIRVGYEFIKKVVDAGTTYEPGTKVFYTYIIAPVAEISTNPTLTPILPPGVKPSSTPTVKHTPTRTIAPTGANPTATKACELGTVITVLNDTGAQVTIRFTGPATFSFTLDPGTHQLRLCTGQYEYTATGCNGATLTGTAGNGDEIEFWCE